MSPWPWVGCEGCWFDLLAPPFSLSSSCLCAEGMAGTAGMVSTFSECLLEDWYDFWSLPDEARRRFWLSFRLGFRPSVVTLRSLGSWVGALLAGSEGDDLVAAIVRSSDCFFFLDLRPKGQKAMSFSGPFSSSSPPLARRLLRRQHMRADSLRDLGDKSANHVALMNVDLCGRMITFHARGLMWVMGAYYQLRKVHVRTGVATGCVVSDLSLTVAEPE